MGEEERKEEGEEDQEERRGRGGGNRISLSVCRQPIAPPFREGLAQAHS